MDKKDYIEGVTSTGFKYKIEKRRLNNYILLELMGDLETNPLLITKVVRLLLGDEQKDKLVEHIKDDDGIVDMEKMNSEIEDIFRADVDIKN